MESQEQWELNLVRDRHRWLKLTPKQIRAVWKMENEENQMLQAGASLRVWGSFTFWEKHDYDIDRWQAILKPDQFKLYKADQDKLLHAEEKLMRQQNQRDAKEVEYYERYTEWLTKKFFPGFFGEMKIEGTMVRIRLIDKIDYLRAEFVNHQLQNRKKAIISHYRYHRRQQPNTLKLTLLRQEVSALIPDYFYFVRHADAGVNAVGQIVLEQNRSWFAHKGDFILEKLKPIREEAKALRLKFFGDETPKGGWQFVMERKSDLTPAEEGWMSYLLMANAPGSIWDTLAGK